VVKHVLIKKTDFLFSKKIQKHAKYDQLAVHKLSFGRDSYYSYFGFV